MDDGLNNLENWVKDFFKTSIGKRIKKKILEHERRLRKLETAEERLKRTHIDLEMFGIKLFKARLINASKSILIAIISIGLLLIFLYKVL